jgi:outer membrane lipopolysaccharide assembly protein LptE/RlpB
VIQVNKLLIAYTAFCFSSLLREKRSLHDAGQEKWSFKSGTSLYLVKMRKWDSMLRFTLAAFLTSVLILTGCGYHTANSAAHLPQTVHILAVPTFANHTQSFHTEVAFTNAVIREFTSRTPYKVLATDKPDSGDAILEGAVNTYQVIPLTYNVQTGQSSSYLITINASVTLLDRDKRVLYENKTYTFRQQYQTTQDLVSFIQEDPAAVQRLSRDFAQALVSDILESF